MDKTQFNNKGYDELIEASLRNVRKMLKVVDDFLSYSKLDADVVVPNKKRGSINGCIQEVIQNSQGYLSFCKVYVELILDESQPEVEFDWDMIVMVIENLSSNAAKFSNENGQIIIRTSHDKNYIKFEIQDFGLGIKTEDHHKIFNVFSSRFIKNRTGISSSGLGLSITKKIIEKHKGRIGFESKEGEGSVFYFMLPITSNALISK